MASMKLARHFRSYFAAFMLPLYLVASVACGCSAPAWAVGSSGRGQEHGCCEGEAGSRAPGPHAPTADHSPGCKHCGDSQLLPTAHQDLAGPAIALASPPSILTAASDLPSPVLHAIQPPCCPGPPPLRPKRHLSLKCSLLL